MGADKGEWVKGVAHWRDGETAYVSVAFTWRFEQAASAGQVPEYIVRDFEAMAHLAIAYFSECIAKGQKPS